MQYRALGQSGLVVSQVGLGTMTFGREAGHKESASLYKLARDKGVNFFDTANAYAGGMSEEILGSLISGHRDEIILASKAGTHIDPAPHQRGANRVHLSHALDQSLKRLKTHYFDIYYIHYFDPHTNWDFTLKWLDDAVSSGKIRYAGLSNFAAWQIASCLGACDLHHWHKPIVI